MMAMTDPPCRPLMTLSPIDEPERPDRLAEPLECMADLLVEARRPWLRIADYFYSDEPPMRDAIARVAAPERSLGNIGVDGASVHHLLQPVHLL
jgi:hypothetical protein